MPLKIATWNIRLGIQKGIEEVIRVINEIKPDILLVQEIGFYWSMGPHLNVPLKIATSCGFDYHDFAPTIDTQHLAHLSQQHSEKLTETLSDHEPTSSCRRGETRTCSQEEDLGENHHPSHPIAPKKPASPQLGFFGHAIFCRASLEPRRESVILLPSGDGIESRLLLVTQIKTEVGKVQVISTHLSHVEDRPMQGDALNNVLHDFRGEKILLGGDLNEADNPEWFQSLSQRLTMAPNEKATFPSNNPTSRIDYLFANFGKWSHVEVVDSGEVSDHLPLVAELRVYRPLRLL